MSLGSFKAKGGRFSSEADAIAQAASLNCHYGFCVFDGRFYVGEEADLNKFMIDVKCGSCNLPPAGPVPAYCRVHDGNYSNWLVSNNID